MNETLTGSESIRAFLQARVWRLAVARWLVVFTILGALLRIPVMINYSMFIDDGATLLAASLPMEKLIANRFAMGHIPLFFILFKMWEGLAGDSIVALRVPSYLFSLATVPLSGLLCAPLRSPRGALVAMAVAVFHGTLLRHAAELRMYSWMMVVGPMLAFTMMSGVERPAWWKWVLATVLHFLFLTLHVSAILFSVSAFGAMAICARPDPARRGKWLGFAAAFLIPVLIILPMMLYLKGHADMREYEKFLGMNPHRQLLACFYELVNGIGMGGNTWKQAVIGIALPTLTLVIFLRRKYDASDAKPGVVYTPSRVALIYLCAGLMSPVLAYVISISFKPAIGFARYYVTGTPMLLAFFGAGVAAIGATRSRTLMMVYSAFAVALVVTAEMTFYRVRRIVTHEETGLNSLVQRLRQDAPNGGNVVLADQGATRRIVEVYLGENLQRYKILPINGDWTEKQTMDELQKSVGRNDDVFLLFFREEDPRLIESIRKFYGKSTTDKFERGDAKYLHISPAR